MQEVEVASILKELGHPTRILIYKKLAKAGYNGCTVGDIQKELNIPASTLSHHLFIMASVGLIKQIKQSRMIYCVAQFEPVNNAIKFLLEECCSE